MAPKDEAPGTASRGFACVMSVWSGWPDLNPATTCTPSRCATRLRYIPIESVDLSITLVEEGQDFAELVAHLDAAPRACSSAASAPASARRS